MRGNACFAGRVLAVGFIALAGTVISAGVASAGTLGSCSAEGQYATCVASGSVNNPVSISVTVTASSNQSVSVAWADTCSEGLGVGSASGSFSAETPVTQTISHPYAHPDNCVVSADAQLNGGGNSIHVAISPTAQAPPAIQVTAIKGYAGRCVNDLQNSSANGTKVVLWSCTGGAAQNWAYTSDELVHDGRCLTDPGTSGNGSKLILNGCSSAKNDLWIHKSGGEYVLAAGDGKLCLNDPGSSTQDGTQLNVYTCKNTANQHWTLP
jgi:Ricin-type beta-trefoil lectin domain